VQTVILESTKFQLATGQLVLKDHCICINQLSVVSGAAVFKFARPLSRAIYLDYGSGIFSGYNRIVVVDRLTLNSYNIEPFSGHVELLPDAIYRWQVSPG
jgi:hypothetical protein